VGALFDISGALKLYFKNEIRFWVKEPGKEPTKEDINKAELLFNKLVTFDYPEKFSHVPNSFKNDSKWIKDTFSQFIARTEWNTFIISNTHVFSRFHHLFDFDVNRVIYQFYAWHSETMRVMDGVDKEFKFYIKNDVPFEIAISLLFSESITWRINKFDIEMFGKKNYAMCLEANKVLASAVKQLPSRKKP